jgi:serine/threonine protein kinase
VKTNGKRACEVCGTALNENSEFCPVCALQGAVSLRTESLSATSSELCFEHYQVLKNEDGTPMELGRGGMGVTYKAIDTHLRCPVALKIISTQLLGNESARSRFLREARAAASVRHSNVASVFHLGESGGNYFYAMEFVDGETLEALLHRRGPLETELALEIVTQVAAGLTAIHKQHLVHRDIKPSNIMVAWEEGRLENVKIIDLGLAKGITEDRLSIAGSFIGTPTYASPEQFAGLGTDIRSDLYSLGVMFWEMLSGKRPFRGSAAELMEQHLHTPPPIKLLKIVPQPVIVLLEMLLAKDPAQRFQTANELLNILPRVRRATQAKQNLKSQEIQTALVHRPIPRQQRLSAIRVPKRSIAVLPFDTLGHRKASTYFADGVQDEILSNLAKVSQLRVTSRTSVMTYRSDTNRDLRAIANSLKVANVVEGTVRRDGNRIRVAVRLVDARKDMSIWSETYDCQLTDIFTIQSEVAQTIAHKLAATLSPQEKERIEAKPTDNLQAYDRYFQAKQLSDFARFAQYRSDF